MSVKPPLCQNCGATVSLRESGCRCCGVRYVFESGRMVMNRLDMEQIEHDDRAIRNGLPEKVVEILASYPEERIIFKHDWKNLKNRFLVTNERIVFYKEDMTDYWLLRFEDFAGSSMGQERNSLSRLGDAPFLVTLKFHNSNDDVWLRLPGIFPPGTSYSTLRTAVHNAYSLWLTNKKSKQS
jgi:hypothetical protein